ncbi:MULTISPECIES: PDDEXK nuclease domain-containing protein [Burkholderiaceae]|uniref:PDDEXK nuclease domain-containing protein n=1 Tax=Burkholderiaceae TaxID=119060 RepID=UPI00078757FF|nr:MULTISPECIES: PDDEXK nuclease domain-containing protein [Burkholderiaceae]MCA8336228.1 PDDEXK nuclease domain-containing protein [Burkholderia multivorans]
MNKKPLPLAEKTPAVPTGYAGIHSGIVELLDAARLAAARSVNALMTASYWEIGRRIIEAEQQGKRRAGYGQQLMVRLSADLTAQFGRGFSPDNLENMRLFFLTYPQPAISETLSRKSGSALSAEKSEAVSRKLGLAELAQVFTLPWSAYVRLLSVKDGHARQFYEAEALRGGWSVRQLDRQINSQFYERTALSKNKAAMLVKGAVPKPADAVTADDAIKDPFVLEFLDLKDEYSESDLEHALIRRLEDFLLELGDGFTFVGRQRRLRIDQTWYRVDLLFFHRKLHCLVIIDLKLGALSHADVGQMHLYCNYAKEHWTFADENPPVGLILCADKGHALARYALEGLPSKVMAANYKMVLPDAEVLQKELENTRRLIESHGKLLPKKRKK